MQGAGGIGGLLARSERTGTGETYGFYNADKLGNVTEIADSLQLVAPKYIYDPYGNLLAKSGPMADSNLYRFSSKELKEKSDHVRRRRTTDSNETTRVYSSKICTNGHNAPFFSPKNELYGFLVDI